MWLFNEPRMPRDALIILGASVTRVAERQSAFETSVIRVY